MEDMKSSALKMTPKDQVPHQGKIKKVFKYLSFYPRLLKTFNKIRNEGAVPFEEAIDLTKVSTSRPVLKQKDPALTFYTHLKVLAKKARRHRDN